MILTSNHQNVTSLSLGSRGYLSQVGSISLKAFLRYHVHKPDRWRTEGQPEKTKASIEKPMLAKLCFIYKELLQLSQEEPTQAIFALTLLVQWVWMVQTHDCWLSCGGFAGEEATCHWPERKREMKHRLDKPRRLYEPHKLTETGKTPLEVSLHKGDVALSTAHFSPEDPWGEGVDGRDVRTWPLSGSGALSRRNEDSKRELSPQCPPDQRLPFRFQ